jgi:hypothetical protein
VATPKPSSVLSNAIPTPTAAESSEFHSNAGAIAGGVVDGVGGLILLILTSWLLVRKRKHLHPREESEETAYERAQLHADEVRPDHKALEGTKAENALLQKKPEDISELPANQDVVDKGRSG